MEPIENPRQLVEYLESFYSIVQTGIDRKAYGFWTTNLRADLGAIADPAIKKKAFELFAHVEGGAYVLMRNPEMREDVVMPTIRRLIDYLKDAFGL